MVTKIELALSIRAKDTNGETIIVGEKLVEIENSEQLEYDDDWCVDFSYVITLDVHSIKEYNYPPFDDE